jgi:hypothetical protein
VGNSAAWDASTAQPAFQQQAMTISVAGIQRMGVTPVARPIWIPGRQPAVSATHRAAARPNMMHIY